MPPGAIEKKDGIGLFGVEEVLSPLSQVEAMELLLDKMGKTKSNAEFLSSMSSQG